MFDVHIHAGGKEPDLDAFGARLAEAGVDAAIILSQPPGSFLDADKRVRPEARLENVLAWCRTGSLYPFYWLDPTDDDAAQQVQNAVDAGIAGFKIICDHFYVSDKKVLEICCAIAAAGKPILFHSGILWDGKVSAKYNHPMEFECLLEVPRLRFALAHVSWPWCDELIALYGKFMNSYAQKPDLSVEMFIDTTPGTPEIYREDVLRKLFTVGYDVENNVLFGTDCATGNYNTRWALDWKNRDEEIMKRLGMGAETIGKYFAGNARRFLGLDCSRIEKRLPRPGV
jgi:predicted TIM-barrel fold metal-dependent hydrolase